MSSAPIGVFDSGVGGLSVVREIQQRLPGENIVYVADTRFNPYGEKDRQQVQQRSRHISHFLLSQAVKAIVVACNTATALAADILRAEFKIPIIAMEPAIKPAAQITRTDVIGVLATAGTLASDRYGHLRDRHGQRITVLEQYCPRWVTLVEEGLLNSDQALRQVTADLQPLLDQGADTLVLGCTHFPFLRPLIEQVAGPEIALIDPAPAVAAQLEHRLRSESLLSSERSGKLILYSSGNITTLERISAAVLMNTAKVRKLS